MKSFLTGIALATLAVSASAQVYVGGNVGWAKIPTTCEAGYSCKDDSIGYRVHIGYNDTAKIAGELGYLNFGSSKFDGGGNVHGKIKAHAVTLGLAFRNEFQPGLKGVLRIGAASVSVEQTSNIAPKDDGNGMNLHLGLGLEYNILPNLQATGALDATRGSTDGGNSGGLFLLSAGLQYQF